MFSWLKPDSCPLKVNAGRSTLAERFTTHNWRDLNQNISGKPPAGAATHLFTALNWTTDLDGRKKKIKPIGAATRMPARAPNGKESGGAVAGAINGKEPPGEAVVAATNGKEPGGSVAAATNGKEPCDAAAGATNGIESAGTVTGASRGKVTAAASAPSVGVRYGKRRGETTYTFKSFQLKRRPGLKEKVVPTEPRKSSANGAEKK